MSYIKKNKKKGLICIHLKYIFTRASSRIILCGYLWRYLETNLRKLHYVFLKEK